MRFTIRDLFWLILLASFVACWYRERVELQKARKMDNDAAATEISALERRLDAIQIENKMNAAYRRYFQDKYDPKFIPTNFPGPNDL